MFAVMGLLLSRGPVRLLYGAESAGNPAFAALHVDQKPSMRCKRAAIWKARRCASASPTPPSSRPLTTDASNGAVNAMHDSFTPLGGMIPMLNMELGEIIFGGVGSGLYGMLLFAIVAMFVAGLMVGRTPEYLGKKLESKEVKMAMLAILVLPFSNLGSRRSRPWPRDWRASPMRGRTASPKSFTPSRRRPVTTAAPLPDLPPTRCSTI
jgi:K+-transporting ATPase ATPase A chain